MNLSERDRNMIWHPFTPYDPKKSTIAILRGEGARIIDENGKEYIDAVSSWWTNIFGHAQAQIAAAIAKQATELEHVIFAGFTHRPAIEVAEKLLKLLPAHQGRIFFSDNGSTSVEVALKMAIQYWSNKGETRKAVIAFRNAYHGDTFGAMSVGARGLFNRPFEELLFEVDVIDVPDAENIDQVLNELKRIIAEKKVAAFIFEPLIQGSAGMLMYEAHLLDELISVAQAAGVLCIADEVMTGFGRTGKTFASGHLQQQPDIFCLSKGITGGFLPLGITSCSDKVFAAFQTTDKQKTFFHGHSYTGNPLACAAASASLDILSASSGLIRDLVALQTEMAESLKVHNRISGLRQTGTIVAFEVKYGEKDSYFNDIRDVLYERFLLEGVLLRPLGNTVYVMPPYVISRQELERVYEVIHRVLDSL